MTAIRRGAVVLVRFDPAEGSEIRKTRVEFRHSGFRRVVDRSDYQHGWQGFFAAQERVALDL